MGKVKSRARFEGEKTHKGEEGEGTKEMCDGAYWYCQCPKGKTRLYKQRRSRKLLRKVKLPQRTPVPCKKV
jgi:hypothetical protein